MAPERKSQYEQLREGFRNAEEPLQVPLGFMGAVLGAAGAGLPRVNEDIASEKYNTIVNRAGAVSSYFDKVDPRLKEAFLKTYKDSERLEFLPEAERIIDQTYSRFTEEFKPSDLSSAGKFREALSNMTKKSDQYGDLIMTVTPGPNPTRFADPNILETDLQRGYIWGNTDTPQYSYAEGNLSQLGIKKPEDFSNPSIHLIQANLAPESKGDYLQTREVLNDPSLTKTRVWGIRDKDIMFPKETVTARGLVTASDLYTAIKQRGETPPPRRLNARPGDYLAALSSQYAQLSGKPVNTALLDLASPVAPLGTVSRELGTTPQKLPFDLKSLTPDEKIKAGFDSVFIPSNVKSRYWSANLNIAGTRLPYVVNPILASPPPTELASRFAGSNRFLRPGMVGAVGAISPDVIEDLYEGRPGTAAFKAGASVATGAATDALLRAAAVKAAEAGYLAPVRALTSLSNLAGPVGLALSLGGDTPQPQVVGTYKGAPVYRNPQGAFIAEPSGESPVRLGKAVLGGKTVYVPWGSVAGSGPVQTGTYQGAPVMRSPTGVLTTQTTPTSTPQRLGTAIRGGKQVYVPWGSVAGRPWWDVGQYFGR